MLKYFIFTLTATNFSSYFAQCRQQFSVLLITIRQQVEAKKELKGNIKLIFDKRSETQLRIKANVALGHSFLTHSPYRVYNLTMCSASEVGVWQSYRAWLALTGLELQHFEKYPTCKFLLNMALSAKRHRGQKTWVTWIFSCQAYSQTLFSLSTCHAE